MAAHPLLVICQRSKACRGLSPALAALFGEENILHLTSAEAFTRWLFSQPRGGVVPSAILLAGWSEAKPCAAAIQAARSGCTDGLRPDGKRPELQPPERRHGADPCIPASPWVEVAVDRLIVLPETKQESSLRKLQHMKAVQWVRAGSAETAGLCIAVAFGKGEVFRILSGLAPKTQSPAKDPSLKCPASTPSGAAEEAEGAYRVPRLEIASELRTKLQQLSTELESEPTTVEVESEPTKIEVETAQSLGRRGTRQPLAGELGQSSAARLPPAEGSQLLHTSSAVALPGEAASVLRAPKPSSAAAFQRPSGVLADPPVAWQAAAHHQRLPSYDYYQASDAAIAWAWRMAMRAHAPDMPEEFDAHSVPRALTTPLEPVWLEVEL